MGDALDSLERNILSDELQDTQLHKSLTERYPKLYKSILGLFTLLGYAFIFGIPLCALVLILLLPEHIIHASDYWDVSVIFIEISVILFCLSLSIALFQLQLPQPAGRVLKKEEARELFALISELTYRLSPKRLQPKLDLIKISQHFEIHCVRTPKKGFPLAFTNTLVLGLPLLQSVSPTQLKTLIARETLHLSGARSRFSSWVVFSVNYYCQLKQSLKKLIKTPNVLLLILFSWYSPLIRLLSSPMHTQETCYLDKTLAEMDTQQQTLDAILQSYISQAYLQQSFWPELSNSAYTHESPPYLPYASLEQHLASKLEQKTALQILSHALSDSHDPDFDISLSHRLLNLNVENPSPPEAHGESSASYFLGASLNSIIAQMDRIWHKRIQFIWQKKYNKGKKELLQLEQLANQLHKGLLSQGKAWAYLQLVKRYKPQEQAISIYKQALKLYPKSAHIHFEVGKLLLALQQLAGVGALEYAIELNPEKYTLSACQILIRHHMKSDNHRAAQACRRRSLAYQVNNS